MAEIATKPLSDSDVAEFVTLTEITKERYAGMSEDELARFNTRNASNELVFNFLNARGFNVRYAKDRRGRQCLDGDEITKKAALQLEIGIVCR